MEIKVDCTVIPVSVELVEEDWTKVYPVENRSVELLIPFSVVLDTCDTESEDIVESELFEAGNGVESQQTFGRSNPPTFSFPQIKLV